MNRERAQELLPIIQAFADGKQIQYRNRPEAEFSDISKPSFVDDSEYRIAPEPMEIWTVQNKMNDQTLQTVIEDPDDWDNNFIKRKFREVTDE